METLATLKNLQPSFVSMTYGAGGHTRTQTATLVSKIKNEIGLETMAHLTCVGHTQEELAEVLQEHLSHGIENILALRGDPPKGETKFTPTKDGFAHASELVSFIRSRFSFGVGVAGYPEKHIESPNMEEDLTHQINKVKAGADFIITQLFFNNDDYFHFVNRLKDKGVDVPVIAGIMPITDFDQTKRFASMCGAKIPMDLMGKLEKTNGDKLKVFQIGVEHAALQCRALLDKNIPGIHFYTLNKSTATQEIFLKLKKMGW